MDTFGSRLPDGIRSSSPTPPGSWRGFWLRYGLMSETPACSDRSGRAAIVAPVTALPAPLTGRKVTAPDGAAV